MANKKYNEFPEGSYDPGKIFLQADPSTGALEKIFIPPYSLPLKAILYLALGSDGTITITCLFGIEDDQVAGSHLSAGKWRLTFSPDFDFDPFTDAGLFISQADAGVMLTKNDWDSDYIGFQTEVNNILTDVEATYWLIINIVPAAI